jgi:hypothetical protein
MFDVLNWHYFLSSLIANTLQGSNFSCYFLFISPTSIFFAFNFYVYLSSHVSLVLQFV